MAGFTGTQERPQGFNTMEDGMAGLTPLDGTALQAFADSLPPQSATEEDGFSSLIPGGGRAVLGNSAKRRPAVEAFNGIGIAPNVGGIALGEPLGADELAAFAAEVMPAQRGTSAAAQQEPETQFNSRV